MAQQSCFARSIRRAMVELLMQSIGTTGGVVDNAPSAGDR